MRRVGEIMTTQVVTATPSTPFKRLVELLTVRRIGGLPVVDEHDRVLGVVSEADLLLKQEYPRDHQPGLGERLRHRADRARSHGTVAKDFMSSPAITIGEGARVGEAARLLHARHIKRLPVTDELGTLVGIVSRPDLLRVFLRSDEDIQAAVREEVIGRQMGMDPGRFFVYVDRGVVTLEGRCERRSLLPVLVRLVYGVDGVVHVDQRLGWDLDDTPARLPQFTALGP
ncbi:MAG TPA: CBS domain-containing protein [Actinomycetota bacterium]|nr:CBS domain-containing protein [Actinomycetota bacterium]